MDKIIRILIMEDCVTDDYLTDELRAARIPFISIRGIKEEDLFRVFQDFSPDLILSDHDIPQYNGALNWGKQRFDLPNLPISSRRYLRGLDYNNAHQWC